jgi:hypothetical protein
MTKQYAPDGSVREQTGLGPPLQGNYWLTGGKGPLFQSPLTQFGVYTIHIPKLVYSSMVGRSSGTLLTRVQIMVLTPFLRFITGFSGVMH